MFKYYTVEDHFRSNGERHLERAISYISAGFPDRYYQGSMGKAERNFKKAEGLKLPDFLNSIVGKLANSVADTILNGK